MDKKITTVKVLTDIYNDFKRLNIESGFSLQKLVNRSMYLYVNENEFKEKIENTQLSGSLSF